MLNKALHYPGLTAASKEIPKMVADVARRQAVLTYKKVQTCPWVVFLGGTGTGKSTLFNAFCGKSISETGVERPKTSGPILYAPDHCNISSGFPFENIIIEEDLSKDQGEFKGFSDRLLLLTHAKEILRNLVVVDTPDLDSVEVIHHETAEDFFLLSDVVVFVASQEKYADDMTCRFLSRVIAADRPLYFLLNKAQKPLVEDEILEPLNNQGISLSRKRVWLIAYEGINTAKRISQQETFQSFADTLLNDITSEGIDFFKATHLDQREKDLIKRARRLESLLQEELDESKVWLDKLSNLCSEASKALMESEKQRFLNESSGYIQREIKKLFYRYDVLAKPRQFVRYILRTPLEVLGILKGTTHSGQKEALSNVRGKIVFATIFRALDHFNRKVLDILSPKDPSSPLYDGLRQDHVILTEEEVRTTVLNEQDNLDRWLEKRFEKLAHDLPRRKKWGIYSTSILWGVLILSFEVIVGGGFTVLDAALDSVIAPFVTKGTVELFASREIRKVAKELAQRYQQGLLSVIAKQKARYDDCLRGLLPPKGAMDELRRLT
jgi:GTPase Era involved in 16S rRNA processing